MPSTPPELPEGATPPAPQHHHITLLDTGESFDCTPGESVLHGLARMGKRGIPVGCRGGGCGICKIEVVSGDYRSKVMSRAHVSAEEEARGQVLACRICAEGDLEVKVIGKMQKAVKRTLDWQSQIGRDAA